MGEGVMREGVTCGGFYWLQLLYPDIYVDADTSLVSALEDHTHHFLPITENWMKKALNTWY